jgi:hypothetical protein
LAVRIPVVISLLYLMKNWQVVNHLLCFGIDLSTFRLKLIIIIIIASYAFTIKTYPPPNLSLHASCGLSLLGDVKVLPTKYQGVRSGRGPALPAKFLPPPGFFQTRPKTDYRPARKQNKNCSCILEGRLTTNPILSALPPSK